MKRAVTGLAILFALVGGGAWMLHAGISTDGTRNLAAVQSGVIRFTGDLTPTSLDRLQRTEWTGLKTLILTTAATDDVSSRIDDNGGLAELTAQLARPGLVAIASFDLARQLRTTDTLTPSLGRTATGWFAQADRLLENGFRGVVLDISGLDVVQLHRAADAVVTFAEHVRHQRPNTLILLRGHEEIVARHGILRTIDGVISTDLLGDATTPAEAKTQVASAAFVASQHYLDRVARNGKLVVVTAAASVPESVRTAFAETIQARSYRLVNVDTQVFHRAAVNGKILSDESISFSSTGAQ